MRMKKDECKHGGTPARCVPSNSALIHAHALSLAVEPFTDRSIVINNEGYLQAHVSAVSHTQYSPECPPRLHHTGKQPYWSESRPKLNTGAEGY